MRATTPTEIRAVDFVADVLEGARHLVIEHWLEVCTRTDLFALQPHVDRYRALAAMKSLISLGGFVGDELAGYACTIVMPHLHYADTIIAANDVLFVTARQRRSRVGALLIRETERIAARDHGASVITWHAKRGSALDRMMGRTGRDYWVQDIVYAKELH